MNAPANITRFLFEIPGAQDVLRVVGFEAEQALSSLYRCELELASENPALDLKALVGTSGALTLVDAQEPQYLHGEIVAARQEASGKRFTLYRIALQPKLALLGYRSNLRIFQDLSVPDIVNQLLDEAGITGKDVRFELTSAYPTRRYCTQYRETDLRFIERLLAEEGIFYWFEHSNERHVLVISDNRNSFKPVAGKASVRYKQRTGMVASEESIYRFSQRHAIRTGKVSLRDFYFEKSRLLLEKESRKEPFQTLEDYCYPGNFSDPADGKRLAGLRLQSHQADAITVQGQSDCARLAVGRRFTLYDHPRKDLNSEYTLTAVVLRGRQPQSLEENASAEGTRLDLEFAAIPATVDYRPVRIDSKPQIEGCQTAFVTGPGGEEIYTDQYGRVKVQFHWDREGRYDEDSSCWIRVSQGWAGNQWGSMVIPRIGMEVIVSFLNGDPDQPLITGTTYNGSQPPPYPLPAHKTRTTFKSISTPGGGGYNELRIEDKKGSEEIYLHAEKDLDLYVKNDLKEWIGNERHQSVQNHQYVDIKKDQHLTVEKAHNLKTGKNLSSTIGKDHQLKISGNYSAQAGQVISVKAGMTLVIEAGTELTLKAGGGIVKLDPSGVTIKGPLVRINSGGAAIPAQPAIPTGPSAPAAAERGEGPGQASAQALVNGRRAATVEKVPANNIAENQVVSAKNTSVLADEYVPNSTLTVKVAKASTGTPVAKASVKILGPSGAKEATTNEYGEAEFNGLLPGRYSAKALLPQVEGKPAKNPKTDSVQLGANSKSELPLLVGEKFILQLLSKRKTPLANKKFLLESSQGSFEGRTSAGGMLEIDVDKPLTQGEIKLWVNSKDGMPDVIVPFTTSGDELPDVSTVRGQQIRLNNLGYNAGPVDGIAGAKTKAAAKAFQGKSSLQVDGIIGPKTQAKLKEIYQQ